MASRSGFIGSESRRGACDAMHAWTGGPGMLAVQPRPVPAKAVEPRRQIHGGPADTGSCHRSRDSFGTSVRNIAAAPLGLGAQGPVPTAMCQQMMI